ncbi:MAG: hypothetical protein WBO34_05490 [Gammaproteobacteria bacterium]
MNDRASSAMESFRDTLEQGGTGFIYTAPARDDCVHIRFIGNFADRPVIWDATIMTLEYWHTTGGHDQHFHRDSQFIEIDAGAGDLRTIRIGLQLERIDEQAILKTLIMIRKYKRLHIGRHEFSYTSLLR